MGVPVERDCRVDAGVRHVHVGRRDVVLLHQPVPAPRARRDHRRRGRDHLPLGDPGQDVVDTDRQVDQQHDPQPRTRRHQHLREPGREQPVDEHDRPVRDPVEGPLQAAPPDIRRPRPPAVDLADLDLPAEVPQGGADPSVVGVAAARPPRVVDAPRHQDVQDTRGHSDLS